MVTYTLVAHDGFEHRLATGKIIRTGEKRTAVLDLAPAELAELQRIAQSTAPGGSSAERWLRCLVAGPTELRPVAFYLKPGDQYFDTTLNRPFFFTGTRWVDAAGVTA